jgi:cell division protein FtsI (penicillin-binding protein 3)
MKSLQPRFVRWRILILGLGITVGFAVIGGKAFWLLHSQGPWLRGQATGEVEDSQKTLGKRGTIFDRRGREMAVSIDAASIAIRPAKVAHVDAVARDLAAVIKQPAAELKAKLTSGKPFVWVKRQATPKETEAVRELKIPGIQLVTETRRFYPNRTLAAQVIGFTGMDGRGMEGVEFFYDNDLRGTDTSVRVLRDALGNGFQAEAPPETDGSGKNLVLTLDQTVQHITETALLETVEKSRARSGIAIVLEPATGAILAVAHAPTFNPNSPSEVKKSEWRNRSITDPFEPGSTLKVFGAAAALEFAKISPKTTFNCENGAYRIGKNIVHDVHRYGVLSLADIIKFSSNIGAIKISEKVGPERLYQTLRGFGFGQKSGIDSPGETTGLLMPYRKWSDIDTAAISFGHGISVSAVQLVAAFAAIANDGLLMKPYLVQAVTDKQGQVLQQFAPQEVRRVISRQTAATLREILATVVLPGGTGTHAALEGYTAAGKTGTARKVDESGRYSDDRHVASFIGFAPVENAQIAVLVVIDEPKGQIYGGAVAAPVFKAICQPVLNYLNVPPRTGAEKLRVERREGEKG